MYHICTPQCQTQFGLRKKFPGGYGGASEMDGGAARLRDLAHAVVRGLDRVQHQHRIAGTDGRLDLGRAESDLAGLAAFLNGIESDAIVIRIAELSLEPARADPREARSGAPAPSEMGALAMSFIVEAYWMVSDRSAAAAALNVAEIRLTGLPQ